MLIDEALANVLYVNLTKKSFRVDKRPDLFEQSLGGTGVAVRLLAEECPQGADPLGPDNPIVFAIGPLTALFPMASKTVACFKSPLTGNLGESHCGGRSAVSIRMAGYGAIVITGVSDMPVYLAIHGDRIHFRDASAMWGMRSNYTSGRIIRKNEDGAGYRTIMRIGAAGENQVAYSAVTTETYRHFGRLGLGAVFGAKKLKGVLVAGKRSIPVAHSKNYRELYDEIFEAATTSSLMKKYHELGTAGNVAPLNELGGLPTRNLQAARFEDAEQISGEKLAENYLGRRIACAHCPVGCIHIAALREPYENEPYFYKTSMISYDYELIYALGSMLGVGDSQGLLKLMDRVEDLGLDVMSAGVVLAWATEAREQGLIGEKETQDLKLAWGDWEAYLEAADLIVKQPNEFYQALARGVDVAAAKYGGAEFAMAFGGLEMPGYHTGPAAHIGCLVGGRHSHLDNAGYGVDQKVLVKEALTPEEVADSLIEEERWRQVLSGLVICFFARGIYKPELVTRALACAGYDLAEADLDRIGEQVHREKFRFKLREGFSFDDLKLPRRIFETESPLGQVDEEFVRKAVAHVKSVLE